MFSRRVVSTWGCASVVLLGVCILGCSGKESEKSDDGAAPSSSGTDSDPSSTAPGASDPGDTDSTNPEPTDGEPSNTGSAPTASESEPDAEPSTSTDALEPVAPGNPEVLLADLALPGRVAFDGDGIV